ncbi:MAG TPA: nuclear transport factor 2 family protein [Solirubrobacteraceae bacterium]|jgi:hypothetical protein
MGDAAATTAALRAAAEAGDARAAAATFAPDVVLHSPITASGSFRGVAQVERVLEAVFAVLADIRYSDDVGDARTRALFYTARIGGRVLQEATLVRLDDEARIAELTIFFRPLSGLTALAAALGPRLARRHGRGRAVAVAAMTGPLAFATRAGDGLVVRLAKVFDD